jgi:hypothetical protein
MSEKSNMKFIKTSDREMVDQLRINGFTEIGESQDGTYCFLNDGCRLTFDLGKYNAVYTDILHI